MQRNQTAGTHFIALAALTLVGCGRASDHTAAEATGAPHAAQSTEETQPLTGGAIAEEDAGVNADDSNFWNGLVRQSIQLEQTLLVVKGSKGVIACPYLNVDTFNATDEACAIVPAADFEGMLESNVTAVSDSAEGLGISVGMNGREALNRIR